MAASYGAILFLPNGKEYCCFEDLIKSKDFDNIENSFLNSNHYLELIKFSPLSNSEIELHENTSESFNDSQMDWNDYLISNYYLHSAYPAF